MPSVSQLLKNFDDDALFAMQQQAATVEEITALGAIRVNFTRIRLKEAMDDFIGGSIVLLELSSQLIGNIQKIGNAPALEELLEAAESLLAKLQGDEGVKHAKNTNTAEEKKPPKIDFDSETLKPNIGSGSIKTPQSTSMSTKYKNLEQEYIDFINGATIKPEHRHAVAKNADKAVANKSRYEFVGKQLGIPWWFIAGLHQMESSYIFSRHLHNGDPLSGRTKQKPKGRPESGKPPFTWEESAADALALKKLHLENNWSISRALFLWETYNGFGYRIKKLPSPYLWSFTTLYDEGKYVSDGVFDKNAKSKQCGVGALLLQLIETGHVALDQGEVEDGTSPDFSKDIAAAKIVSNPPMVTAENLTGFHAFFAEHLSDIRHFRPDELLYKGASHAKNGLNTDPPAHLWPNVIALARLLDAIRQEIGKPMKLLSIYRSPDYNNSVDGKPGSIHKKFKAADFTVLGGGGGPADWAKVANRLQIGNVQFKGGLGTYHSQNFVHVDVRGENRRWVKN